MRSVRSYAVHRRDKIERVHTVDSLLPPLSLLPPRSQHLTIVLTYFYYSSLHMRCATADTERRET